MTGKLAGALAVSMLLLAACGNLLDPAAAVVGGKKITIEEVEQALDEYVQSRDYREAAEQGDPQTIKRAFEQEYLTREIRRAVLLPEAEERGVEVTEQEVEDALARIERDFPNEGAFREALKEQGLSPEELETIVRDNELELQLRAEVTADLLPSEAELRSDYEDKIVEFTETEVAHILVRAKPTAERLLERLRGAPPGALEERFETLAEQNSIDQTSFATGGDLGFIRPGQFPEDFERAVAKLREGELSGVVRTESGFHLILIGERRELPFDDVRAAIEGRLAGEERDAAWEEWLRDAYEEADVAVNPRFGELNPTSQFVEDPGSGPTPGGASVMPSPGSGS